MTLQVITRRFNFEPDDIMLSLAKYAHDQDFGIRKISEASKISTVIGADYPPLQLAEIFASGELWNESLEEVYKTQLSKIAFALSQIRHIRKVWRLWNGKELPVVYVLMPEGDILKVSVAGIHCIEKLGAKVVVIIQRYPFISMRISCDVSELHAGKILSFFGGGGHQGAASAGGKNATFPYKTANDDNFDIIVSELDSEISRLAGVKSFNAD